MADQRPDTKERVTPEVGDEGGSPGDVEIAADRIPGSGSEGTETWRPVDPEARPDLRDETDQGRR
jgi:hypothetical protein